MALKFVSVNLTNDSPHVITTIIFNQNCLHIFFRDKVFKLKTNGVWLSTSNVICDLQHSQSPFYYYIFVGINCGVNEQKLFYIFSVKTFVRPLIVYCINDRIIWRGFICKRLRKSISLFIFIFYNFISNSHF